VAAGRPLSAFMRTTLHN